MGLIRLLGRPRRGAFERAPCRAGLSTRTNLLPEVSIEGLCALHRPSVGRCAEERYLNGEEAMKANVGDRLVISAHRVGEHERDAEILDVRGEDGDRPISCGGRTTITSV